MFCDNCGDNIDDDSIYCPSCGTKLIVQDIDIKKASFLLKITGVLIIIVGVFGIINTVISGINNLYQNIFVLLYILGVIYGYRLTKKDGWIVSFALTLIYFIHFAGIISEKFAEAPALYLGLSFISLIFLLITRKEFRGTG